MSVTLLPDPAFTRLGVLAQARHSHSAQTPCSTCTEAAALSLAAKNQLATIENDYLAAEKVYLAAKNRHETMQYRVELVEIRHDEPPPRRGNSCCDDTMFILGCIGGVLFVLLIIVCAVGDMVQLVNRK